MKCKALREEPSLNPSNDRCLGYKHPIQEKLGSSESSAALAQYLWQSVPTLSPMVSDVIALHVPLLSVAVIDVMYEYDNIFMRFKRFKESCYTCRNSSHMAAMA